MHHNAPMGAHRSCRGATPLKVPPRRLVNAGYLFNVAFTFG
jgi:hypothetical protein